MEHGYKFFLYAHALKSICLHRLPIGWNYYADYHVAAIQKR